MDVYHQISAGVHYPATLIEVGLNDARVPYWEGAKLAARMQDAMTGNVPVLLSVDAEAGHIGSNTLQTSTSIADMYGFFFWQLGMLEANLPRLGDSQ
jgi:prolyl oligopeptidase